MDLEETVQSVDADELRRRVVELTPPPAWETAHPVTDRTEFGDLLLIRLDRYSGFCHPASLEGVPFEEFRAVPVHPGKMHVYGKAGDLIEFCGWLNAPPVRRRRKSLGGGSWPSWHGGRR